MHKPVSPFLPFLLACMEIKLMASDVHRKLNHAVTIRNLNSPLCLLLYCNTTLLQPQPQQKAFILWNNPTDCTLSQLKCAELCRLACPRSHPDSPNHCLTTCGTNFWTANKQYFTPAPHQPDHFYLWFHTFKKTAISANLQSQQMQLEGYDTGQNIF